MGRYGRSGGLSLGPIFYVIRGQTPAKRRGKTTMTHRKWVGAAIWHVPLWDSFCLQIIRPPRQGTINNVFRQDGGWVEWATGPTGPGSDTKRCPIRNLCCGVMTRPRLFWQNLCPHRWELDCTPVIQQYAPRLRENPGRAPVSKP